MPGKLARGKHNWSAREISNVNERRFVGYAARILVTSALLIAMSVYFERKYARYLHNSCSVKRKKPNRRPDRKYIWSCN